MSKRNNNKPQPRREVDDEGEADGDRTGSKNQQKGKSDQKKTRSNPSRKAFNNKRAQDFREKQGDKYVDEYNKKLKEKWMAGVEEPEKLESRLKETANQKAQMLSITTRGIGANLISSIFTTTAYRRDVSTPNIYSLYRVCLATLEAKVQSLKSSYPIPPRFVEAAAQLNNTADFERICRTVVFLPKPVTSVINAVGITKNGNTIYLPTFDKDHTDSAGRFIPTPESVRYGNLRKVVVALSSTDTPLAYRRAFYERNCIPGTKWANHLLLNPNDIMPPEHDLDELARDGIKISPWMNQIQKYVPKLVGSTVSFESTGKKSMFICNSQENMRIPDLLENETLENYYLRCVPEGNIRTYQCPYEITAAERLEGQLNLLGERPIYGNFKDPIFTHRLESRCEFEFATSYLSMLQLSYGF